MQSKGAKIWNTVLFYLSNLKACWIICLSVHILFCESFLTLERWSVSRACQLVTRITCYIDLDGIFISWSLMILTPPRITTFQVWSEKLESCQSIICVSNVLELFRTYLHLFGPSPQLAWSFTDWQLSSPQTVLIYIPEINPTSYCTPLKLKLWNNLFF